MPRSAACVISIEVLGLRQNINTVVVPKAIKHLINAFISMRITEMEDFCFMLQIHSFEENCIIALLFGYCSSLHYFCMLLFPI